MAVPARKTSKAKKRLRRTHQTVVKPEISFDEANGDYRRSHHVSLKGYYNGKKVIKGASKQFIYNFEEGLKYYLETTQQSLDKSTFYRSMVERGIITETGLPTQQAIENGLVKDYYEDQGLSFDEFIRIYPIFEEYDKELFQCIDGYWEIPVDMKENLVSQLESGELNFEDAQQIQAYLEDR